MVTQRKPKASKYLINTHTPVQVDRDRSVAGLLEKMEGTGFGGRQLAEDIGSGSTCSAITRRLWWLLLAL